MDHPSLQAKSSGLTLLGRSLLEVERCLLSSLLKHGMNSNLLGFVKEYYLSITFSLS